MSPTKQCAMCHITKPITEFYTKTSKCKICRRIMDSSRKLPKQGVVADIYRAQNQHSKDRTHPPPDYTKEELSTWLSSQPLFDKLYNTWVDSEYNKDLKPSVDRKDNDLPYTFSNIQLMTWRENHDKEQKPVKQLSTDGILITIHPSVAKAGRKVNRNKGSIIGCCRGRTKTCAGYRWEYV